MFSQISGIEGVCAMCQLKTEYSAQWLCADCTEHLPWVGHHCRTCTALISPKTSDGMCGKCLARPNPINSLVAPFTYDYPISQWLPQFKFNQYTELAKWFGGWLATEIALRSLTLPDIIVPVPLHPSRQKQRGYNQAALIAKCVAKELDTPYRSNLIRRIKSTSAQSGLTLKERQNNIRGAFKVITNNVPKRIGIVDDVLTTGSTIHSLAKQLKEKGCEEIYAFVVAVVPKSGK